MSQKSSKFMTIFEKSSILGIRSQQISMNAPVMVDTNGETNPRRIALMELRSGKLSMIIRRRLPDNTYEDCPVNDLIVPD